MNEQKESKERVVSPGQLVLRRFFRHKLAMVGFVTLVAITLFCVFGPFFSSYGEYEQFFEVRTSFTAEQLERLIDEDVVDMSSRLQAIHFEGNKIKSKIMKSTLEVPSAETYTVKQALNKEIPPDIDPEGLYRLFQVGIQDAEMKRLAAEGLIEWKDSALLFRAPVSRQHLLGTDGDGFDVFTRLMYGGRISLLIGLVCVSIMILIGMTLGGVAGYFGGWLDAVLMRIVDIFNALPMFPIVILLNSALRIYNEPMRNFFVAINPNLTMEFVKLIILMIIIGLLSWPGVARLVRGQILSLREQEFMLATQATGLRSGRRIFKHLIPNVVPQLIVQATLSVGSVILFESALSFLGLGVAIPFATWGVMVNSVNDSQIMMNCPYIWVPPGVAILLTVMAINFLGDGLRDAFDPKMKR